MLLLSCGERVLLLLGCCELLHCQSAGPLEQLQYMKLLSDIKHLHLFSVINAKALEAYANVTYNYFSRITCKEAERYCGTLLQTKVFQSWPSHVWPLIAIIHNTNIYKHTGSHYYYYYSTLIIVLRVESASSVRYSPVEGNCNQTG